MNERVEQEELARETGSLIGSEAADESLVETVVHAIDMAATVAGDLLDLGDVI